MDLRQLEVFRQVVDSGSVSEAARRLHMSQPPVTYAVRQLEQELGAPLFERSARGMTPTEAGRLLYARAVGLLEYARSTRAEVSQIGRRRILRLGITSSTVATVLPLIARYHAAHPQDRFEVCDGATFTLLQKLRDGILDLTVARTPAPLEDFACRPLCTEPMIAAAPPDAPFESARLSLQSLEGRPLILYRRYEELIRSAFARQGLSPELLCICDDARDALLWVRAGLATALFPRSMRSLCAGLPLAELDEPELTTQALLVWRRGAPPAPAARDFLALCPPEKPE